MNYRFYNVKLLEVGIDVNFFQTRLEKSLWRVVWLIVNLQAIFCSSVK